MKRMNTDGIWISADDYVETGTGYPGSVRHILGRQPDFLADAPPKPTWLEACRIARTQ